MLDPCPRVPEHPEGQWNCEEGADEDRRDESKETSEELAGRGRDRGNPQKLRSRAAEVDDELGQEKAEEQDCGEHHQPRENPECPQVATLARSFVVHPDDRSELSAAEFDRWASLRLYGDKLGLGRGARIHDPGPDGLVASSK